MSLITTTFSNPTAYSQSALIPVEVSDSSGTIVYRQAVPLAQNASLNYDFKPGVYLVRGFLPSGEIAAATVDLSGVPQTIASLRSTRHSPRESLDWAYYLQKGPKKGTPAIELSMDWKFAPAPAIPATIVTNFWRHNQLGWKHVAVNPGGQQVGLYSSVNFDWTVNQQDPNAIVLIEIMSEMPWQYNLGQFWIQVAAGTKSRFVAVPPTQVMRIYIVDHDPESDWDSPFRVVVGSGDPSLQALLGFLSSGDFESARSVGANWADLAERMLKEKLVDAISATVAGYFLLLAGEHSRLHDWTRNLADWIDWLPDGAVIRAFHLLSQTNPDLNEVRERLLQAAKRGVPLYTQGLRMLFDGLNLMNTYKRGSDPELQHALEAIRPYAAAARWASPVTSFAAVDPANPKLSEGSLSNVAPYGIAVPAPA